MQQWTNEKIDKMIRAGRGQGDGPEYQPFLTVHDLSSTGRCHRIYSAKLGRYVQLFSDTEHKAFLLAERSPRVVDIKEQYPIDRDLSQSVARAIGIRHPTYPRTRVPVVLTVDLLVTLREPAGHVTVGLDTKIKTDVENRRVIEKLELTRACLARSGYRHVVVFDVQLPKQLIRNLDAIRGARPYEKEVFPYPNYLEDAVDKLHQHLTHLLFGRKQLRAVCEEFDLAAGLYPGTALRAARLLVDRHLLNADLDHEDLEKLPMQAFSLSPQPVGRSVGGIL